MKRLRFVPPLLLLLASAVQGGEDHGATTVYAQPPARTSATADSISYASEIANGNLVGITITNYGFIGNNFVSRDPSLEYPLGAGYEHLVRGGLWVGATAADAGGTFNGVMTGTVDGAQGGSALQATEWTPAGNSILVRSSLTNNKNYDTHAISEQDFVSEYSDMPAKRSADNGENSRPMGLLVHQENYAWSFADFAHSNFFHFQIINHGPPLQNAWVGIYAELASGCKKCQSQWPASGWFNKKWIATDDTLTMKSADSVKAIPLLFREHYCESTPTPANCNLGVAPYWMGIKVLGWKRSRSDTVVNKKTTFTAWRWARGSSLRDQDTERYDLMSSGTVLPITAQSDSLQPGSGDPVELIAVGPFSEIDPGDTISADFAFVGGAEIKDIQEHSRFAQRAFDRNYIVPVPPPSPRLKAIARHNAIDLYWDNSPESFIDITSPLPKDFEGYRVYVGEDRLDLHRVAQYDLSVPPHDTTGFNTGLEAVRHDTTFAGDTTHYHYRYTIDHVRDGFKYFVAVTSYDLGTTEIESLESGIVQNKTLVVPAPTANEKVGGGGVVVFPNPYRVEARWDQGQKVRDHYLWFANLPARATIKIFTLSGDLVYETDFDGASYHGATARGLYNPRTDLDIKAPTLSGRTFAWNMITMGGQAAGTGLYIFAVEDKATGDKQRGKFLIVKSDREDF